MQGSRLCFHYSPALGNLDQLSVPCKVAALSIGPKHAGSALGNIRKLRRLQTQMLNPPRREEWKAQN